MNGTFTADTYTYTIEQRMREDVDKFILETISPFCERTIKRELSKKDLTEALNVWLAYKSGRLKWVEEGAEE